MPQRWEKIKTWRERAEELRRIAESFLVPSGQDALRRSAQGYDRMADDLERKLKQEGIAPPRPGASVP
jgi:hypothetical protein